VPARLFRRLGKVPSARLEALSESVRALRRPGAALARHGLQGPGRLVLGAADLADGAAGPRLRALAQEAAGLVAPPRAPVGAAGAARRLPGLGLQRPVPAPVRAVHVPRGRGARLRDDALRR